MKINLKKVTKKYKNSKSNSIKVNKTIQFLKSRFLNSKTSTKSFNKNSIRWNSHIKFKKSNHPKKFKPNKKLLILYKKISIKLK